MRKSDFDRYSRLFNTTCRKLLSYYYICYAANTSMESPERGKKKEQRGKKKEQRLESNILLKNYTKKVM